MAAENNPAAVRETVTQAYKGTFSFTSPGSGGNYAANDAVGPTGGGAAALEFANMGPKGAEVIITSVWLRIDATALISGEGSYRFALFNIAPPSGLADNAAFTLAAGDRDSFLGFVDIGTPVTQGQSLWVESNGLLKQVTLSSAGIWAYLLTAGVYAPASRVFTGGIKTMLV